MARLIESNHMHPAFQQSGDTPGMKSAVIEVAVKQEHGAGGLGMAYRMGRKMLHEDMLSGRFQVAHFMGYPVKLQPVKTSVERRNMAFGRGDRIALVPEPLPDLVYIVQASYPSRGSSAPAW